MCQKYILKPVPPCDNLAGSYELLQDALNKVTASITSKNKSYMLHAARNAQGALNEVAENSGIKAFDVMQYFDTDAPEMFKDEFINKMNEYKKEYEKAGCNILRFNTFEELYDYCMGAKQF